MIDIASIIGILLGFIAVGVGMMLKGASLTALLNPAAIMIIIVGTVATIFIGFPLEDIKKVPKLFKVIFTKQVMITEKEIVSQFVTWCNLSRREGLLALESQMSEVNDEFLKSGMTMVIDGSDAEFIQDVLNEQIAAMEERHSEGALIFSQAGGAAPTLGVLGAVVGLIAALSNLNDIDALGHMISAAFVATLLGIFTGYVLWHPMANKLKVKSRKEALTKRIMIEGILSIQAGDSQSALLSKMAIYLKPDDLKAITEGNNE